MLAVFAVPGAYSVVNLEHHQYICKFDSEDNTNENYISHCDKCYFYFDELASNTYHYLESNISSILKFRHYADNIYLTKNHFYKKEDLHLSFKFPLFNLNNDSHRRG